MKKKRLALFLAMCFCFSMSSSSMAKTGAIVLALSGGGTKGLAHVGVLKALKAEGIPIAGIVGTSMGAIIGGLSAAGYSPQELEDVLEKVDIGGIILGNGENRNSEPKNREISPLMPKLELNAHGQVIGPKGPLSGATALNLFQKLTSRVSVVQFNELPIPFAAVATDLETGEKVVLRHGSLASAMRASMSIPGLFEPWPIEGRLLVDGGLVSNMPVTTAKEMFPDYPIVAVNVCSDLRKSDEMKTMVDVIDQTITILTSQNVDREESKADVIIKPKVGNMATLGNVEIRDMVRLGVVAAEDKMAAIKSLAVRAPSAPEHRPTILRLVRRISVEGVPEDFADNIKGKFSDWIGRPVHPEDIVSAAEWIRSREDVKTVDYQLVEKIDGVDVLLKIQRQPAYRIALDGHATNLSGGSWIGIRSRMMDLAYDGDYLNVDAILGDDWAAKADYHFAVDKGSYEMGLRAGRVSMKPRGKWDMLSLSIGRTFGTDGSSLTIGALGSKMEGSGQTVEAWGPIVKWYSSGIKGQDAPEDESYLSFGAWYPSEGEEMLFRIEGGVDKPLSSRWRGYLKAGLMEGNSDGRYIGQGAYLGAREELYSLADRPILGERFAWWRLGFRRRLGESGDSLWEGELFGGQGYVWDNGGDLFDEPWEVGVALTVPSRLLKARFLAIYDDDNDWTFGFSIGDPMWTLRYPFP
ncbi:Patatin [Dethiosulfovibrio peptidovorans DSM 11002]|uniref:Patatin n=1 Tax=Dethiosulfovibrio peptidovorans DSM 11002 TaxID=469381 RepID=D2Z887_9BACT|nr:patatin-like phospholipase family protein [Dethiosulfovibrio peptidovorans]EFC91684.1 Patatin [Dethiosulfovibrio peptidovorans DSM 11002]